MKKSFEDILKHKGDELELEPNPGQWKLIESQLNSPTKKRRTIFFLLPLTAVLCAVGGYFIGAERAENAALYNPSKNEITLQNSNPGPLGSMQTKSNGIALHQKPEPVLQGVGVFEIFPIVAKQSIVNEANGNGELQVLNPILEKAMEAPFTVGSSNFMVQESNAMDSSEEVQTPIENVSFLTPEIQKNEIPTDLPEKIRFMEAFASSYLSNSLMQGKDELSVLAKESDRAILTSGAGFHVGFQGKRTRIFTGLQVHTLGYNREYLFVQDQFLAAADSGSNEYYVLPGTTNLPSNQLANSKRTISAYRISNKYNYLNIPIGISYQILKHNNIELYTTVALNVTLGIRKTGVAFDPQYNAYSQLSKPYVKIGGWGLQPSLGCDFAYTMAPKTALFLRPMFGFSANAIENYPISSKHRYSSLSAGLRINLK